jgi:phosphoglycerol transferase MdoB-like AlkP superfamily enzyme
MKQDGKNIKVNETNRNKRMANMMQIVKQADWAVKKAVDTAVR